MLGMPNGADALYLAVRWLGQRNTIIHGEGIFVLRPMIEYLLSQGFDPNRKTANESAYQYASGNAHISSIFILNGYREYLVKEDISHYITELKNELAAKNERIAELEKKLAIKE